MKLLIQLCFICVLYNSTSCLFEEIAGSYYARFKGVSECGYNVTGSIKFYCQLSRVNRTTLTLKVNVTLPRDMDTELRYRIVLKNKGTNGYTWNPVLDTTWKCCEFERKFAYQFVISNINASGLTYECPLKKGSRQFQYYFKEPFCNPFDNIPVIMYGDYKLEFSYYTNDTTGLVRDACRRIYFELRPVYETNGICQ